jgi:hypothetical protein
MNRLFRIFAVGNIILAALTWSSWFEGTDRKIGFSDRLFGNLRLFNFRIDFVWLVASIPFFCLASIYYIRLAKENRIARKDAGLGVLAALSSCLAIFWMIVSGLLYFG